MDGNSESGGGTGGTGGGVGAGEFAWMQTLGNLDEHHEDYELSLFVKKVIDAGLLIRMQEAVKYVENAEVIEEWGTEEAKNLKNLVGNKDKTRITRSKIDTLIHDCVVAKENAENGALVSSTQELFEVEDEEQSGDESDESDEGYDKKDSKTLRSQLAEKEAEIEILEAYGTSIQSEQKMITNIFRQTAEEKRKEMKEELTKVHSIVKGHHFQKMTVVEKRVTLAITNALFYESLTDGYVYDPTAVKGALVNVTTLIGGEEMPGEDVFSSLKSDGFKALASVIDSSIKAQSAPAKIESLRAEHKKLKAALALKLYDEQEAREDKKMAKEKAAAKKRIESSPVGGSSSSKRARK